MAVVLQNHYHVGQKDNDTPSINHEIGSTGSIDINAADNHAIAISSESSSINQANSVICLVCGSTAANSGLKSITCESCQIFFRTYSNSPEVTACSVGGNCPLILSTRYACKYCWMKKCLQVGMHQEQKERITNDNNSNIETNCDNYAAYHMSTHEIGDMTDLIDSTAQEGIDQGFNTASKPSIIMPMNIKNEVDDTLPSRGSDCVQENEEGKGTEIKDCPKERIINKRPAKKVPLLFCRICGDKASGFNFNTISCESCKAFFRRYAAREQDLQCPHQGTCEISVKTRRNCQSCRLQKCYRAGMNVDHLVTKDDSQPKRKRIKVEATEYASTFVSNTPTKNGKGKMSIPCLGPRQQCPIFSLDPLGPGKTTNDEFQIGIRMSKSELVKILLSNDNQRKQLLQVLDPSLNFKLDSCINNTDTTDIANSWKPPRIECTSVSNQSIDFTSPSTSCSVAATVVGKPSCQRADVGRETVDILCSSPGSNWHVRSMTASHVTPYKNGVIRTDGLPPFINGQRARDTNPVKRLPANTTGVFTLQDYANLFRHVITRLIKQHTRLSTFNSLSSRDQLALVQGTMRELIVLHFASKYDPTTATIDIQYPGNSGVSLDVIKGISVPIHDKVKEIASSYPKEWRLDEKLMLVLSAIAFFNPTRTNPTDRKLVENARSNYMQLLINYLERTYGRDEANKAYMYLIKSVHTLCEWSKEGDRSLIFTVNPRTFDLLLMDFPNAYLRM